MSEHTPGPLHVINNIYIADSDNKLVATVSVRINDKPAIDVLEMNANAEFIVKTWNAHDQLTVACKAAYNALFMISDEEGSEQWDEIIDQLRKAISKAKGKK